jgi:hypothetical protein
MNIFATSDCPVASAQALDDKRVIKMILETAQLLSMAVNGPYKPTHQNHPCAIWACATRANAAWLWRHGMALCDIYFVRYGRVHACAGPIEDMLSTINDEVLSSICGDRPTSFQNSARNGEHKLDFTHLPVHEAYRTYLAHRWSTDKRLPTWGGRPVPQFGQW